MSEEVVAEVLRQINAGVRAALHRAGDGLAGPGALMVGTVGVLTTQKEMR